jgi:hypothetical protein
VSPKIQLNLKLGRKNLNFFISSKGAKGEINKVVSKIGCGIIDCVI